MPRAPEPTDLARLRVPTDICLSPDGQQACCVVKESSRIWRATGSRTGSSDIPRGARVGRCWRPGGSPFRRIENLEHIRDWFVHYLARGMRALPPA
jgi:hypothetical protein